MHYTEFTNLWEAVLQAYGRNFDECMRKWMRSYCKIRIKIFNWNLMYLQPQTVQYSAVSKTTNLFFKYANFAHVPLFTQVFFWVMMWYKLGDQNICIQDSEFHWVHSTEYISLVPPGFPRDQLLFLKRFSPNKSKA